MVEVRARHCYGRLALARRGARIHTVQNHVYVSLRVRRLDTTEHAYSRSRPSRRWRERE